MTYQVVILGLKQGQEREEALRRLAATFNQPVERLHSLVSGSRAVVKRGADIALAAKLQAAIEAAGFEAVVEPEIREASTVSAQPSAQGVVATRPVASIGIRAMGDSRVATPSQRKGMSPIVKYCGGLIIALVALGFGLVAFYPKLPTKVAIPVSSTNEALDSTGSTNPDARFSPSERLMLRLANTSWKCSVGNSTDVTMGFLVTATEANGGVDGLLTLWDTNNSAGTAHKGYFWFWKDSLKWQKFAQQVGLKDNEFGAVEVGALASGNLKGIAVEGVELSEDGTRLKVHDARGDSRTFANCALDELVNSKKVKATEDTKIRAMLLKKRTSGSAKPSASPSAQPQPDLPRPSPPPTAAAAFQAMEQHQDTCQVRGNIGCVAICEQAKNALLKLATQLSLNPEVATPPQFRDVVDRYRLLCVGQGR